MKKYRTLKFNIKLFVPLWWGLYGDKDTSPKEQLFNQERQCDWPTFAQGCPATVDSYTDPPDDSRRQLQNLREDTYSCLHK